MPKRPLTGEDTGGRRPGDGVVREIRRADSMPPIC